MSVQRLFAVVDEALRAGEVCVVIVSDDGLALARPIQPQDVKGTTPLDPRAPRKPTTTEELEVPYDASLHHQNRKMKGR
jgi:hypothetical protein